MVYGNSTFLCSFSKRFQNEKIKKNYAPLLAAGFYAKLLTSFLQVLIQHFFDLIFILPKGINRRFAKIETQSFYELSLSSSVNDL